MLIEICKPYEDINIKLMTDNSNENNSNNFLIIISNKENKSLVIKFEKNGSYNISKYYNNKIIKINNNKNIPNILKNFIKKNNN